MRVRYVLRIPLSLKLWSRKSEVKLNPDCIKTYRLCLIPFGMGPQSGDFTIDQAGREDTIGLKYRSFGVEQVGNGIW